MGAALMEEPEKLCGVRLSSLFQFVALWTKYHIMTQTASNKTNHIAHYFHIQIDLEELGRQLWIARDMQDQDLPRPGKNIEAREDDRGHRNQGLGSSLPVQG